MQVDNVQGPRGSFTVLLSMGLTTPVFLIPPKSVRDMMCRENISSYRLPCLKTKVHQQDVSILGWGGRSRSA